MLIHHQISDTFWKGAPLLQGSSIHVYSIFTPYIFKNALHDLYAWVGEKSAHSPGRHTEGMRTQGLSGNILAYTWAIKKKSNSCSNRTVIYWIFQKIVKHIRRMTNRSWLFLLVMNIQVVSLTSISKRAEDSWRISWIPVTAIQEKNATRCKLETKRRDWCSSNTRHKQKSIEHYTETHVHIKPRTRYWRFCNVLSTHKTTTRISTSIHG